jgi:hypothetical protein
MKSAMVCVFVAFCPGHALSKEAQKPPYFKQAAMKGDTASAPASDPLSRATQEATLQLTPTPPAISCAGSPCCAHLR